MGLVTLVVPVSWLSWCPGLSWFMLPANYVTPFSNSVSQFHKPPLVSVAAARTAEAEGWLASAVRAVEEFPRNEDASRW